MDAEKNPPAPGKTWFLRFIGWPFKSVWRVFLTGFIGLVSLIIFFYIAEDYRGKRAWENCKNELKAKGEVLDWNAYIPPPVPDDQNIFKAPKMQEWFVGRGTNELSLRLDAATTWKFQPGH